MEIALLVVTVATALAGYYVAGNKPAPVRIRTKTGRRARHR